MKNLFSRNSQFFTYLDLKKSAINSFLAHVPLKKKNHIGLDTINIKPQNFSSYSLPPLLYHLFIENFSTFLLVSQEKLKEIQAENDVMSELIHEFHSSFKPSRKIDAEAQTLLQEQLGTGAQLLEFGRKWIQNGRVKI